MDTAKIYHDSEGNECSIGQIIKREPYWAANRLQEGENAIERVKELEAKIESLKGSAVCDCQGCFAIDNL